MYYIICKSVLIKCDDVSSDENMTYISFKNVSILGARPVNKLYPCFDCQDNFLIWKLSYTMAKCDPSSISKNDTFSTLNISIFDSEQTIPFDVSSDEEAELFFEVI